MTDEQIETALNACMFGQTKADRCKDCPLDSDKEPCITNLHLAALAYIRRLNHRAKVAERALGIACTKLSPNDGLSCFEMGHGWSCAHEEYESKCADCRKEWLIKQAEKELLG